MEDNWWRVSEEHFSVDNIRKYFARSPPVSAQDVDGWRPREHVAFLIRRTMRNFTTSLESTWSCSSFQATSTQVCRRCCEAPLEIWGAEQLRTGCLSILMFLTPLAEVTP